MLPHPPPAVPLDKIALFLDFDGTLVDIAERPDAIAVVAGTLATLDRLRTSLGGAIAIVTGRDIEDIDRYLSPLQLCVAGVHGLVRRDARGGRHAAAFEPRLLGGFEDRLASAIAQHDGLLLERKPGAVALHYRARPDLATACLQAVDRARAGETQLAVVEGKMVIETRLDGHSKGTAITAFMAEPPFAGRTPVFIGDDVTDEDGFAVVNALGGMTVKVGDGDTQAVYRLEDPQALRAWLEELTAVTVDAPEGVEK